MTQPRPHITVRMDQAQIDAIDALAARYGMSRGQFALQLIKLGWRSIPKDDRAAKATTA